MNRTGLTTFTGSIADRLRGDFSKPEFGRVILPFTVLRPLDCVLDATVVARDIQPNPFLDD